MGKARTVTEVLSARMRALREDAGRLQEHVAGSAQFYGLGWTQSTVTAYEHGRRTFTADLVLLLPLILSRALKRPMTLADLFTEPVRLSDRLSLSPEAVGGILKGEPEPALILGRKGTGKSALYARCAELWTNVSRTELAAAVQGAVEDPGGEAERKVARRYGLPPEVVASAAHLLWGQNLTAERERRTSERLDVTATERSQRMIRSHITRGLIEDMEPMLEQARRGAK